MVHAAEVLERLVRDVKIVIKNFSHKGGFGVR